MKTVTNKYGNSLLISNYDHLKLEVEDVWRNSHYVFEKNPSDGTRYTVQVTPALYGGLNVICNETSLWRWHGEGDLRFLCGDWEENTPRYWCVRRAVDQIMTYHDARMKEMRGE
jgi:hypothetical protein